MNAILAHPAPHGHRASAPAARSIVGLKISGGEGLPLDGIAPGQPAATALTPGLLKLSPRRVPRLEPALPASAAGRPPAVRARAVYAPAASPHRSTVAPAAPRDGA